MRAPHMKVRLAQIEVVPNKPEKNVARMLDVIADAKRESADLVAFPEMCVGGYLLGDKWQDSNYCRDLMEYNGRLRDASTDLAVAYGNVYVDDTINDRVNEKRGHHPNKDGRPRKYNAVYVFQNGEPAPRLKETRFLPRGIEPKTLLPDYRIFDEERYFFSTQDIAKDFGASLESLLQPLLVQVRGSHVPIGFELCEDMWCENYRRNLEPLNPTKTLIENGAKFIVNLSASPWTFGKNKSRDKRLRFLKSQSARGFVPFFYVNCVGVQNNGKDFALFDGGSTVYDADGRPAVVGDSNYNQQLITVDPSRLPESPAPRDEPTKTEQQFRGIVRGIRHMSDIFGRTPKYVVGLSGGIDSAVVASLTTIAVGKQNVVGVNMPTKYNRRDTRDSATHVAESLGIEYHVIPIDDLVESNRRVLLGEGARRTLGRTLEQNIQAKVRAQVLSNLAESHAGLYTCNGNKWEIATGYSTLDGDARGALCPIGDLTKSDVFRMGEYLNTKIFKRDVIPRDVIELRIEPGAELEPNQTNPLKLGYHCALIEAFMDFNASSAEDVMRWYAEGTLEKNLGVDAATLRRNNIDRPREFLRDMDWFTSQVNRSVFKRVQCPPIVLLSKTAYGYDRRESILPLNESLQYRRLKERVLSMKAYRPTREG